MFRTLLAHLLEALHKRHLVYCVRVISVGYYQGWSGTGIKSKIVVLSLEVGRVYALFHFC
jgi:hypothetical protein